MRLRRETALSLKTALAAGVTIIPAAARILTVAGAAIAAVVAVIVAVATITVVAAVTVAGATITVVAAVTDAVVGVGATMALETDITPDNTRSPDIIVGT